LRGSLAFMAQRIANLPFPGMGTGTKFSESIYLPESENGSQPNN
jgi:hypothetical protein